MFNVGLKNYGDIHQSKAYAGFIDNYHLSNFIQNKTLHKPYE